MLVFKVPDTNMDWLPPFVTVTDPKLASVILPAKESDGSLEDCSYLLAVLAMYTYLKLVVKIPFLTDFTVQGFVVFRLAHDPPKIFCLKGNVI